MKNDYKLVHIAEVATEKQNTSHKFVKKTHGEVRVAQPVSEPASRQTQLQVTPAQTVTE